MKRDIYQTALQAANQQLIDINRDLYHRMVCFSFAGEFSELGYLLSCGEKIPFEPAYFVDCKDQNSHEMIDMIAKIGDTSRALEIKNEITYKETTQPTGKVMIPYLDPYLLQISMLPVHIYASQVKIFATAVNLIQDRKFLKPGKYAYSVANETRCNTAILSDSTDPNVLLLKSCIEYMEVIKLRIVLLNGLHIDADYFTPCKYEIRAA